MANTAHDKGERLVGFHTRQVFQVFGKTAKTILSRMDRSRKGGDHGS
jgi:hypothetical protein